MSLESAEFSKVKLNVTEWEGISVQILLILQSHNRLIVIKTVGDSCLEVTSRISKLRAVEFWGSPELEASWPLWVPVMVFNHLCIFSPLLLIWIALFVFCLSISKRSLAASMLSSCSRCFLAFFPNGTNPVCSTFPLTPCYCSWRKGSKTKPTVFCVLMPKSGGGAESQLWVLLMGCPCWHCQYTPCVQITGKQKRQGVHGSNTGRIYCPPSYLVLQSILEEYDRILQKKRHGERFSHWGLLSCWC